MPVERKQVFPILITMFLVVSCGFKEPPAQSPALRTVQAEIVTVSEGETPNIYSATGTVRSVFNAVLASKVSARVTDVKVREGDAIHKGQVLVELDGRELGSTVDLAAANRNAASVAVKNATTVAEMEAKTSRARIATAEAQLYQVAAALSAARAKLDLVKAGPRVQERAQAHLAVEQAASSLKLAKSELDRATQLEASGAISRRQLEITQNALDVSEAQYRTAVESEMIAVEGSRSQELQAATDAVRQAEGARKQAEAGLAQATAAAMQVLVRSSEIQSAKAQLNQSEASLESARVGLAYATVVAPFDGRVVERRVDPGAMAGPGIALLAVEGGEYRFEASVPESVLAQVRTGMDLSVSLGTISDLKGTVAEISPQGDDTSHIFKVKVSLPTQQGIRSGMFGRVKISEQPSKGILITSESTWARDGIRYVYVVDKSGIARLRIITVADDTGNKILVLSGLSSGERIVARGWNQISDGDKVNGG